jgi:hypothetical protein
MNADDRLDRQIRAALEWQAERDARRAPSLSQSARTVASRLGPEPPEIRPTVSLRPTSSRSVQLILVVLLLLALLAATIAIGSSLFRDPFQIQPGPFGLSRTCDVPMQRGTVLEVQRGTNPVTLYADGVLVVDESEAGGTSAATIEGAVVTERRLSPRGVDLLLERVAQAGLTPGCRTLRTRELSGSIRADHDGGTVHLSWSPAGELLFARQASIEEEVIVDALAESLEHPETWLPEDGWAEPVARHIIPERWLLTVNLIDTQVPPGSTLGLPSGRTLEGTDPRYDLVQLPDGVRPGDFGVGFPSPFSPAPRSSVRCGVVSRDEALTAATSIDALDIDEDGSDTLHNDDVTAEVSFGFEPILHPSDGCEGMLALHAQAAAPPEPSPFLPDGNLAHVNPCTIVSGAAMDVLGATEQRVAPSRQPLGEAANACFLATPALTEPVVPGANLSLYPRFIDRDNARRLAESLFGEGFVEESVDNDLSWRNTCPGTATPCGRAIALWSDRHFVVIEFDALLFPIDANVTDETARSFAAAIREGLPD